MSASRLLAAATAALALSATAARAASFSTDFDSQPTGSLASLFAGPGFSFHNGTYASLTDEFGDVIVGSDQWQIDTASDTDFPLQVLNPADFGYGVAISGTNALNGADQTVLIVFDQLVDITGFTVTLDDSSFGDLAAHGIDFVDGSSVRLSAATDQTIPGLVVNVGSVTGVRAIVLPSTAYYDNLSFTYTASAIPEPSSFAALAGLAGLAHSAIRRRRA